MKITVLAENTSSCGLPCEHGLSLYIESNGITILFDAGQSDLFAENANTLGVDLGAVDFAVLSHGHYDHSGGLKRFLALNDHAPVYLSRCAFETHLNASGKNIGVDPVLKEYGGPCPHPIDAGGASPSPTKQRLFFTDGACRISDHISLRSAQEVPDVIDFGSAGLSVIRGGKILPDDFRHEQYLLIEENGRTILFSGCAHKGVINIADRFRPDILFGGFHFMKMPLDDTLRGYAERLNRYKTAYYTCHCTGVEQYRFIEPYIQNLHYIAAGDVIEV